MKRRPLERCGLTIKHCGAIYERGKKIDLPKGEGWYIFVESSEGPHAMRDLQFARNCDAVMAMSALNNAGLNNIRKMREFGAEKVLLLAIGALQW